MTRCASAEGQASEITSGRPNTQYNTGNPLGDAMRRFVALDVLETSTTQFVAGVACHAGPG